VSDACLERLRLVAHRGYPEAFPENTLLGYQQSVVHGARCVETDVQAREVLIRRAQQCRDRHEHDTRSDL